MGKITTGNLNSFAADILRGLTADTAETKTNTKEIKENIEVIKENTKARENNKDKNKESNNILKEALGILKSCNDLMKSFTENINKQTDAFEKQAVSIQKVSKAQKALTSSIKETYTARNKEGEILKTEETGLSLSDSLLKSTSFSNSGKRGTYTQYDDFLKIKTLNGDIVEFNTQFDKARKKIDDATKALENLGSVMKSSGMSDEAIKTDKHFSDLKKSINEYAKQLETLSLADRNTQDANSYTMLLNRFREFDENLKKASVDAEEYKKSLENVAHTIEDVYKELDAQGIESSGFHYVDTTKNVDRYVDSLGRVLKVTREVNKEGETVLGYEVSNRFDQLTEKTEKTYNQINRLNKGLNNLKSTAETKKATELKNEIDGIYVSLSKLNTEITKAHNAGNIKQVNELTQQYHFQQEKLEGLAEQYKEVNAQIRNQGGWMLNLKDSWIKAMRSFTTYMSVTTVFYQGIHAIKGMIDEVKNLDSALTEFKKVSDLAGDSLERYVDKAYEAGEVVAKTGQEMIEAATSFRKSGYGDEMALELGKIANMYTNIADEAVSAADSADFIIAQLKAFNLETGNATETLENAYHVIDAVNEVANNFAVSSADIATNLGKSSAVMANAGNSLEQMIGLMTAGTEITRNASKVANGLKTITLRLQGMNDEGEKSLEVQAQMETLFNKMGISVYKADGQLKNTYEILESLAKIYPKLTNAEKAYVTETIAGKFQAQNAAAILNNWKTAVEATETAMNSQGSAAKENAKVLESIEGYIQKLNNAWEELSRNVIDDDFIKMVINAGTQLLKLLNGIVKLTKTSLGKSIIQATALTSAVIGLNKAFQALQKLESYQRFLQKVRIEMNILRGSIKLYGKEAGVAKAATMKLKVALDYLKAHPAILATAALAAGLAILKSRFDSLQSSIDKYNESVGELDEAETKLKDMSLSLEKASGEERANITKELIELQKELNKEYNLGIKALKSQDNSKLEEQLEYTQKLVEEKKKEAALEVLKNNKGGINFFEALGWSATNLDFLLEIFKGDGLKDGFRKVTEEFKKRANELYDELADSIVDAVLLTEPKIQKAIDDFVSGEYLNEEQLGSAALELQNKIDAILEGMDLTEKQKQAIEDYYIDLIDQMQESFEYSMENVNFNKAYQLYQKQIEDFINKMKENQIYKNDIKEAFDLIEGENGHIDQEKAKIYPKIAAELTNLDAAAAAAGLTFDEFLDKIANADRSIQDMEDSTEVSRKSFTELKEEIDSIVDGYNAVKDAIDEYNESGYINYDTLEKILSLGDEYIDALIDENGNIRDNTDALKVLADAKIQDMLASEEARYYNELVALSQKDESYWAQVAAGSIDAYNGALGGTKPNSEALRKQIDENIKKFDAQAQAAMNAALAVADAQHIQRVGLINSTKVNFKRTTSSRASSSSSSSKSAWEVELENLNNQYKNSEITIEEYIIKLEALRNKYKKVSAAVKQLDQTLREARLEKLEDDYKRGLITVEQYIEGLKELQKAYKEGTKEWNKYADSIKKGLETLLKDRSTNYKNAQSAAVSLLDKELDKLEDLKDETEKYYDDLIKAKEKANEETEKEIELAKLQEALENAKNNKTKRVYVQGLGWQWVADQQAIDEAQQALDDFTREQEIADLERQKEEAVQAIEDQIDAMKAYRDSWKEIVDGYEEEQNRLLLAQIMGANAENDILNQRLEVLEEFRDKYLAILRDLDMINNATADSISQDGVELSSGGSFANGGVVDYTGFAKVHGSASRPEVMLNNSQAAALYSMLKRPQFSNLKFGADGSTQVYNFDNLVLPNVTNARQFLNELKTITNIRKNQ